MNPTRTFLAGLVVSGALIAGTAGTAWSQSATTPTSTSTSPSSSQPAPNQPGRAGAATDPAKIAARCEKIPALLDKASAVTTKIDERIAKLTTALAEANATGHPKVAARIQKRLDALNARHAKVAEKTRKVTTWQAAHCSTTDPAGAPTTTAA